MTSWCHPKPAAAAVRGFLLVGVVPLGGELRRLIARFLLGRKSAAGCWLGYSRDDVRHLRCSVDRGKRQVAGRLPRRYGGCDAAAHHPFVFGRHGLPDNPRWRDLSFGLA